MVSMLDFLEDTPWFVEKLVLFWTSFSRSGLGSVGPIGDELAGQVVEHGCGDLLQCFFVEIGRGHQGGPLAHGGDGALEADAER